MLACFGSRSGPDYRSFTVLQEDLGVKKAFEAPSGGASSVHQDLAAGDDYEAGIRTFVSRYRKCIGSYVRLNEDTRTYVRILR